METVQHTFTVFMDGFAERERLTKEQKRFFVSCFINYVPLYVLALWQGFPEWEISKNALNEQEIRLEVSNNPTSGRRYCSFSVKGKRKAEAYI